MAEDFPTCLYVYSDGSACLQTDPEHDHPADSMFGVVLVQRTSMSVVDEDRLTRRNPEHLDAWRFRLWDR